MFNKSLQKNPKYYKAHYNLGYIYLTKNQPNMALQEFKSAVRYKSDFSYGYYNIGCAYLKLKKYSQARYNFFRALNLKANEDGVKIKFGDTILKEYEDYSIHVEMDESAQRDKYMIDIKPMAYVNAGTIAPNITLMYELSNAATFIYLDAL